MSNREKEPLSHPDIWDGKRPLNLDMDPNWSSEQLEISMPHETQIGDGELPTPEGSFESWFGARRVPLTLALTVAMALGVVSLPHWGKLDASLAKMVEMMDSGRSPVSAQSFADLGKAARALTGGVDAANQVVLGTPGWRDRFGEARFEENRPGKGYVLTMSLDQRQCEAIQSKAWMVDGLSSVQMDAREVWSSKSNPTKQCPVGLFKARWVFLED